LSLTVTIISSLISKKSLLPSPSVILNCYLMMGTSQPPIPSLCTFLALPWCDDFSIRNPSRDWGRHTCNPSSFRCCHQIATVLRSSFEQDHPKIFLQALSSPSIYRLSAPLSQARMWFFFGFFFLFIYVILIKISGLSFISHWHDRRTRCLYLIQQRPKTSLQDLACISTSSSFCPHSHGNFFSFSYLMSYSPLTTQFKTLKPLSSPTDIANDPLLVFDTATIACIWCSNFYAACIWYSILGLLVTLPRWTLCLQRCQFAFTLPYLKSFLFGVLWNPSIRMWISRVNLVFDFSHITQVSFYEFVIDVTILYRNLPILSF
jgi:hypothetical protein